MRRNNDLEAKRRAIFCVGSNPDGIFVLGIVELLISSRNTHTHAYLSGAHAPIVPLYCVRWRYTPLERYLATKSMGEDVWSLVSRQLYESTSNASRQKEEPRVGEHGEGKAPGGEEDLAQEAEKEAAAAFTTPARACTSFALCVGMPGAGKSTLLNTYLNPNNDSVPRPTVALEYMFARRASAANMPKVRMWR